MLTLDAEGDKIKLDTVVMHIWPHRQKSHVYLYSFTNADSMQMILLFIN